jgi:hypothetical protein
VSAVNCAGNWSGVKESSEVMVDRTRPAAGVTVHTFYGSRYVCDGISFTVSGSDNLSGISEYQYSLGTGEEPGALTGGWKSLFTSSSSVFVPVSFSELAGGEESVQDRAELYVRARVKDKGNLWSDVVWSGSVSVDRTAPARPVVNTGREYYNSGALLDSINITANDEESGIVQYAIAVVENNSAQWLESNPVEWEMVQLAGMAQLLKLEDISKGGLALEHTDRVYVVVRAQNSTGSWSEPGYSGELKIDLEPAQFGFLGTMTGHTGAGELVFNHGPFSVNYSVADDVSERVEVLFTLTGPDHALDFPDREQGAFAPKELTDGEYEFTWGFDEALYGIYELSCLVTDQAGNSFETTKQVLRVNEPPTFAFDGEFTTTPGKPVILRSLVTDPDNGGRCYTYKWCFTDYPHGLAGFDGSAASPTAILYHRSSTDQVSEYAVTLEVIDADERSSGVHPGRVIVENTKSGILYADEYWSGTREMTGDITVPAGISLVIEGNTVVSVAGDIENSQRHGLHVAGSLEAGAGAEFTIMSGYAQYWDGIYVTGSADLTGCTIRGAYRAVVAGAGASVVLAGTVFDANFIGVHVFNPGQPITGCSFTNHEVWGIKEEAVPVTRDCVFSANYIDYYEAGRTRLTMEELNGKDGNRGNRCE